MPRPLVLALLLCLSVQSVQAAALERFTGPMPAAILSQHGDAGAAAVFTGGWGYASDDACRILVPAKAPADGLLSEFAGNAQKLVATLRLSLECERAGLTPVSMERVGRTLYTGPQDALFEEMIVELYAVPKDKAAEVAALESAGLSEEERVARTKAMSARSEHVFWFDVSDIRNHNAGVLYGAVRKPRAVAAGGLPMNRLEKAPELIQRSPYLEISPKDYVTAARIDGIDPALVDGGWGYDRESALVQRAPRGETGVDQDFIARQLPLFSLRSILEFDQLQVSGERLHPVDHEKTGQELHETDGKTYDRIVVDIYLVPSADFKEALPLMRERTPENRAALRAMSVKMEREFWFDITEPYARNAKAFEKAAGAPQQ